MRELWEDMLNSRLTGLKLATALAGFSVLATFVLALHALLSAASLQTDIDRAYALQSAEQRLIPGLRDHRGAETDRFDEVLQGLLRQADFGFRYLALRDADGSILAANGRYEALNRSSLLSPTLRRCLRTLLYTRFADSGLLTLRDGDRTLGSLEYAIGSTQARLVRDEAVDRLRTTGWVGGVLALLFGGATLLLLRAALSTPRSAAVAARLRESPTAPGAARQSRATGTATIAETTVENLPPAFDALQIGVIDIDAELRVRQLNETAAAMTGWPAADASGQLVYTVFHARDEAGAPLVSPVERCVREGGVQPPQELRLRPRGGIGRDVVVEARAVPLVGQHSGSRMLFHDVSARIAQRNELKSAARMAEGVIDHLLEAVLTTDRAGVVKSANTRALRMFGYGADEMQRMTVARLLPVPFMNTPGLKLTDYTPGGSARMPKLAGWRKDATTFPAELVVEPMGSGSEERLVVIIRDVTEQMRSQSLAQRLGRLLDSANEEVYIFDAQSLYFIEVNKGARKNLGLKTEQLSRMSLASIATDLEPGLLQTYLARLRGGESEHVTYKANHRRSDGSTYPVEVRLSFSRDEEPPVFMAIALDITEREAAEKRMRQLAHYDTLTGLPNRTLLFDRLKQAMHIAARAERQLAVVFMDLDGFKPVNDVHGHEAGDSVLQAVADRLNAGLRAADTVARFGGDEFVVLAHSMRDADDAAVLAGKIHELFKVPFEVRGEKIMLHTSVGITLYPADHTDAEGLLRHADAAMYQAKQQGRGRTRLFALPGAAGANKAKPERADLAHHIHLGLTSEQFHLQFVPVLTAAGMVAASVADFYWQHPDFGRVDLTETLKAARRAGLNAEIEHWMLRGIAQQHQQAEHQALPALPVLLPLTGRQWRDPEFPDRLNGILEAAAAPLTMLIPLIDGADWVDAADAVQMLWLPLLQEGLRIAVRQPLTDTATGIAFIVLPANETASPDDVTLPLEERLRPYQALRQPLMLEGLTSSTQWEQARRAGAHYGFGPGLQAPLAPIEFAMWCGARNTKAL